jgi:PAS domain S-box-containing protein
MRSAVLADDRNIFMQQEDNYSENIFYKAIECTGGVPYEYIFEDSGHGYYKAAGFGITRLFGITPAEFTEKLFMESIEKFIPVNNNLPDDHVGLRKKLINHEISEYQAEILIRTPSGEKKWIKDTVTIATDDEGEVTGFAGIFFDITQEKNMLLQLEIAREMATEGDRLKTAFLNNLSHEIRTPLNAIVGFTTLLGEPGMMNRRWEFMDIITHSSDHLLEIVDDILEISKIETKIVRLTIKETNLNEMLHRINNRFIPAAAAKNIFLKYDGQLDKEQIIILTDGYKVFQSITKIVHNAIKFTPEDGKVEFGCSIKGDRAYFYVSDTGIGIAKEHRQKIFNPFYQAENRQTQRYEGTGLGLSIAKAYIELLEGQIWFSSELGKGSVFSFYIPMKRV